MEYSHFTTAHMRDFLNERIHEAEREHYANYVAHAVADSETDEGHHVKKSTRVAIQRLEREIPLLREHLANLESEPVQTESESLVDERALRALTLSDLPGLDEVPTATQTETVIDANSVT